MSSHFGGQRRKIAVYSSFVGAEEASAMQSAHWEVVACHDLDEMFYHAETGQLDAIALPFDALDEKSRDTFLSFARLQKDHRPVLVSYASFNPDWIENLVFGFGANIHLRGVVTLGELVHVLDVHFESRAAEAEFHGSRLVE